MKNNELKPIFRYIGGKRWLKSHLNEILKHILENKRNIDTYCEPFSGGLGSLISNTSLLDKYGIKNILINDINIQLIFFYELIQKKPQEMIKEYLKIEKKMDHFKPLNFENIKKSKNKKLIKTSLNDCSKFYNQIRTEFNLNKKNKTLENSARLLFLFNHCFNGIYRENSSGEYNTAYNWDLRDYNQKTKRISNLSDYLNTKNISFNHLSFEKLDFQKNMLIYCDPPYVNEDDKNENKYNKNKFKISDLSLLVEMLNSNNFIFSHYLDERLLNIFIEKFKNNFNYKTIDRTNNISSKMQTRSNIKKEVLIFSN